MFRKKQSKQTVMEAPQAGSSVRDPKGEFAEIYGSALVGQMRMFVVAVCALLVGIVAVIGLWRVAANKVAIPWLVEVSDSGQVLSKPVKLERITPPKAVLMSEIARWLEQIYTIDSKQTLDLFRAANQRASGKALEQFRDLRAAEDTLRKIREQPDYLRTVKVNSVDVSQDGIAFAYITTKESNGTSAPADPKTYRITLHYKLVPGSTEAEIYSNPLGLYITHFNPIAERR